MEAPQPDVSNPWIRHQRRNARTQTWACIYCPNRRIFTSDHDLKAHARVDHREQLPTEDGELEAFLDTFAALSATKRRPYIDSSDLRIPDKVRPRTISRIGTLNINTPRRSEDVGIRDLPEDSQAPEENLLRRRAVIGDGISAGSGNPFQDSSRSPSPPLRRSKARPASGEHESTSDPHTLPRGTQSRPQTGKRPWTEPQKPITKAPSNIASSIAMNKSREKQLDAKPRKPFQSPRDSTSQIPQGNQGGPPPTPTGQHPSMLDKYEIVRQPETRPISQEQLVAEVKGIYAGLVIVEAKCIEVDNKQATLAQADPGAQPKLNNEQWRALIALHRTLLHEHHDFFLASQHPSASPALKRLASKYAMPARMWGHGIHSFLELLRHRLPASLDHMLAFIYLAYSMMALLYETIPAFEDTWIECLGDLGRYRMAIEDDDIRDREVWTGVARYWYSKASDKAPTTGRLYHHLAILARPNALQQLFYYSKSLCVIIPFTSARESILTLFDPVLNADNHHQNQYRLPPLDTSFVKAHGLLFTRKFPERFESTKKEFLGLLDSQIGRVTRKFMEQGYRIAVANYVALIGFAHKDNILMKALASCGSISGIENESFPRPEKDDVRPLPEDFAVRGLLWTEGYFPEGWFANNKIDEEEKYHELPSMTAERKERILWLGTRIANRGHGMDFDGKRFTEEGDHITVAKATAGRGIKGKVNGHDIWAFGDTGAAQNIISARQAKKLRLKVIKSPRNLRMGNSKTVFSRGTATFPWAFAESPDEITNVTAHVLDNFKYGILLCRSFLKDTKTMTDHVGRFVKGIFQRQPMMSFNLLGETSHRLDGFLEDDIRIEGLPDIGSTHNIINEAWAKAHGLQIQSGPQNCGRVYFPDGSSSSTTGRVHTTITLPGGDAIPIVCEVLPDCYVPVVLGENFVFDNNIFSDYADAIHEVEGVDYGNELLPMDYEQPPWHAKVGKKAKVLLQPKSRKHKKKGEPQPEKIASDSTEQARQHRWNDQYQYGKVATREEWDAELGLRESHELRQYPDWRPDPNRPLIRYGPMAGNEDHNHTPVPLEDSSDHSYNYGMFGVDEAAVWQAERPG